MELLLLGLILFLGSHSISIFASDWRNRMVGRLGLIPWQGLYSLVALAGFALIIWGYGEARLQAELLYLPALWQRHLTLLLMLPVFPLLLATYLPGRIQRLTRHPMLLATLVWATSHLVSNGTLADVLLFGGFLVWATTNLLSLSWRSPPVVLGAPPAAINDWIALLGGLGLYTAFLFGLHRYLLGVSLI